MLTGRYKSARGHSKGETRLMLPFPSFFSPSFRLAIAGHVVTFTWLGRGTRKESSSPLQCTGGTHKLNLNKRPMRTVSFGS